MSKTESRRKKPRNKPKESIDHKKLMLKTSIDSIIGGLLSVGIFQSPTFLINSLTGYMVILGFVVLLIILLYVYAIQYNRRIDFYTASMVLIISVVEVFLIGLALGQSIDLIIVVILIVLPSMLIFDKLMG